MTQVAIGSKGATGLAAVALLLGANGAQAAEKSVTLQARAQVLQTVLDCRKLTDGPARLACFDAAVATMGEAEKKGDIVVVDRQQVREARKQAFGISLPSLEMFTRGEKPETLDRIDGVAKQVIRKANGAWMIILEDGARWEQIDTESLPNDPRPGSKVQIKTAALGSFLMKIDGARAVRAHRVN